MFEATVCGRSSLSSEYMAFQILNLFRTLSSCRGEAIYQMRLSSMRYRSDGVTLIGFDSFLQITLVVESKKRYLFKRMFNRATHHPRPSYEKFAEFAWLKIF